MACLLQWKKWVLEKDSNSQYPNIVCVTVYSDSDSKAFPAVENTYGPEEPVWIYLLVAARKGLGNVSEIKKNKK